jgi:putative flippase GtrA
MILVKNKNDLFSHLDHFNWELISKNTGNIFHQLLRYIIVGAIAFIADLTSLFILTEVFGFYYIISASIAFVIGLMINYYLSIKWVFHKRNLSNKWIEFQIFAIIGIIGLFLNAFLMWIFTDYTGVYYLYSKIITAILILFWNFTARKIILFK